MAIVQCENLTKVYGKGETAVTALNSLNLTINPGEFVAVMGPSGCGKSTLLHLVGGLDWPSNGRVLLNGQDVSQMDDSQITEIRRRQMGFIFQFFNLIPVLTAVENAALPLVLDGMKQKDAHAKATDWLQKVGLSDRLGNRPDQLSGGQQQRVAVARALAAEPKLILADEPTGNLDTRSSDEIAMLLRRIADEWGRAVMMVTHDPRIAAYADRIIFLKDGKVVDETKLMSQNGNNAAVVTEMMQQIGD